MHLIADATNNIRIRGTTNTNSSTTDDLDVVSQCLSYEDAEEEDDDITNMNIALCEDYFSLQLRPSRMTVLLSCHYMFQVMGENHPGLNHIINNYVLNLK